MCGGEEEVIECVPWWFIVMWLGSLGLAIFTRSIILCILLVIVSICGGVMILEFNDINEIVRYGLMAGFYAGALVGLWELVYGVRSL